MASLSPAQERSVRLALQLAEALIELRQARALIVALREELELYRRQTMAR